MLTPYEYEQASDYLKPLQIDAKTSQNGTGRSFAGIATYRSNKFAIRQDYDPWTSTIAYITNTTNNSEYDSESSFGITVTHDKVIKDFQSANYGPRGLANYQIDIYKDQEAQQEIYAKLFSNSPWSIKFSTDQFEEQRPVASFRITPLETEIKFIARKTFVFKRKAKILVDTDEVLKTEQTQGGATLEIKKQKEIEVDVFGKLIVTLESTDLSLIKTLSLVKDDPKHLQAIDGIGKVEVQAAAPTPPESEVKEEKEESTEIDVEEVQIDQLEKYASIVEVILRTLQIDSYVEVNKALSLENNITKAIPISPFQGQKGSYKLSDVLADLFKHKIISLDYNQYMNGYTPPTSNGYLAMSQADKVKVAAAYGYHSGLLSDSSLLDKEDFRDNYKVKYTSLMTRYLIPYRQSQNLFEGTNLNYPVYIPLGFFIMILNHSSLLYLTESEGSISPIIYIDYNTEANLCLSTDKMLSADPYKFFIPFEGTTEAYRSLFDKLGVDTDDFWDPNNNNPISTTVGTVNPFRVSDAVTTGYQSYRGKIMNVLVNIDYLLKLIKSHASSDSGNSANLKPLLEELITDMGKAFGNANVFRLGFNDQSDCYFISDDQIVPSKQTMQPNTNELPLYGLNSIAKSISIKTDISSKLANIIAISANSEITNQATGGKEASSFGAFNSNFKDRYKSLTTELDTKVTKKEKNKKAAEEKKKNAKQKAAKQFDEAIKNFYSYSSNSEGMVNLATNYYIDRMAETTVNDAGARASAMIPVTLNFTTDGISGLGMLNGFTINNDLLPYNYKRNRNILGGQSDDSTIGFIIVGLDHTLSENKWTTEIRANMAYIKSVDKYKGGKVSAANTSTALTVILPDFADTSNGGLRSYGTGYRRDSDKCPNQYPGAGSEYSCAEQVKSPESVNSSNFKKYYPDFEFKKGTSDLDLKKAGLTPLTEKDIIDDTTKNRFVLGTIIVDPTDRKFVAHHTGGPRGAASGVYTTFYERGLPAQYVIDGNAKIHRFMPDGAKGWHAGPDYNNKSIGVEITAKDDSDITEAQVKATVRLIHYLGFTKSQVVGHGQIATHKMPTEGKKVVDFVKTKT